MAASGPDATSEVPTWATEVAEAVQKKAGVVDLTVARFPRLSRALGVDNDIDLHRRIVEGSHVYQPGGTATRRLEEQANLRGALAWLWVTPYHLTEEEFEGGFNSSKLRYEGVQARHAWAYDNAQYVLEGAGGRDPLPDVRLLGLSRPPLPRFTSRQRSGSNNLRKYRDALIRYLADLLGDARGLSVIERAPHKTPEPADVAADDVDIDDAPIASADAAPGAIDHAPTPEPRHRLWSSPRSRWGVALVAAAAVLVLAIAGVATKGFGLLAVNEASGVVDLPLAGDPSEAEELPPVPASVYEGPERDVISALSRNSRVVLNSMIDNPNYGDERDFLKVADTDGAPVSKLGVVAGDVYEVTVFFGNDAAPDNEEAASANTRLAFDLPGVAMGFATGRAVLSSANAEPLAVWDTTELVLPNASEQYGIRILRDSAVIHSGGAVDGMKLDTEALVTEGVLLGCDALDGILPPRDECAGFVTFEVRVDQPDFEVVTYAHIKGTETAWSTEAFALDDAILEIGITYQNTGTNQQDNVTLLPIELPDGLEYVEETSRILKKSTGGEWQDSDCTPANGCELGNFRPEGNVHFMFDVMVDMEQLNGLDPSGRLTLDRFAQVETVSGTKDADLRITVLSAN